MPRIAVSQRVSPRVPRGVQCAAGVLLALYPLGAGVLLLTADGWAVNRANVQIWYHVTGLLGVREHVSPEGFAVAANVVLFVPFFAALAMLRPTWWWVLLGAALSTSVELYQGSLGTRIQDPWDIVTNTLGAALGVAAGLAMRRRILSGPAGGATAPTTPDAPPGGSADGPDGGPGGRG